MRLLTFLVACSILCGCSTDNTISDAIKQKQWVCLQDSIISDNVSSNFIYGDIISISDLEINRVRHYPEMDTTWLQLNELLKGHKSFMRFESPTDSTLIVKEYVNKVLKNQFSFKALDKIGTSIEMLEALNGRSIRISIDSSTIQFRLESTLDASTWNQLYHATVENLPSDIKNESIKKSQEQSYMGKTFISLKTSPYFTKFQFFNPRKPKYFPSLLLTEIQEDGSPVFRYVSSEKADSFTPIIGDIVPNDRTEDLTSDEIFYLLSQGTLDIDNSSDFTVETDVEYQYKEDFDKKGISIDQIKEIDFVFNSDDTYVVFHEDRNLASGKFRISKDRGYLLLQGNNDWRRIPLYSDWAGHIYFHYPFKVSTPTPLGEQLFSYYILNVTVSFREPDHDI